MSQDEMTLSTASQPETQAVPQQVAEASSVASVPETTPGALPASSAPQTKSADRSDGVTLLAIYHFILAALFLLGTMGVSLPAVITAIVGVVEDPEALIATVILGVIAVVLMLFTTFFLAVGYGLWTRRQWARIAGMVVAVLSLFAIPIGTLIGAFTIWYLIKPEVVAEFEG